VSPINLHDADQTQRAVASFFSPGGLEGERVSPLCMRPEAGRRLDAVLAGSAHSLSVHAVGRKLGCEDLEKRMLTQFTYGDTSRIKMPLQSSPLSSPE
jgi:hypothetical protein